MNFLLKTSAVTAAMLLALASTAAKADFSDSFEGASVAETGWTLVNRSSSANSAGLWRVGTAIVDTDQNPLVVPHDGEQFAVVGWNSSNSASTNATLSNWMLSPEFFGINNGDTVSFYTTTTPGSTFPDRLEVRLSAAGASINVGTTTTSVGDFSTVLLTVNPTLAVGGYPDDWALVTATISGLAAPVDGRIALRYFVTQGGPNGANSNIIGVDNFSYAAISSVPEPATWALALGGVAGLGLLRRRRQG